MWWRHHRQRMDPDCSSLLPYGRWEREICTERSNVVSVFTEFHCQNSEECAEMCQSQKKIKFFQTPNNRSPVIKTGHYISSEPNYYPERSTREGSVFLRVCPSVHSVRSLFWCTRIFRKKARPSWWEGPGWMEASDLLVVGRTRQERGPIPPCGGKDQARRKLYFSFWWEEQATKESPPCSKRTWLKGDPFFHWKETPPFLDLGRTRQEGGLWQNEKKEWRKGFICFFLDLDSIHFELVSVWIRASGQFTLGRTKFWRRVKICRLLV